MTLSRKLMIDGEQTVITTRTHVKVLFIPVIILLAVAAAGGYLAARVGDSGDGIPRWGVIVVAVVLAILGAVIPFLRWFLWTYTLTNKRIVEQKGILTRTGRVIPLSRINDVAYEKNLNDRILGCGTLVVHDASEQAGLELRDIPHIEALHRTVTRLVDDAHRTSDESI
ncbi:PH domain-containing protein [Aeromicrobium sp.]|uniref:PH domain-containing protein n=1 Tax=Aeromicrobium sp. TaxID=1871063 RepID=UPI003D6C1CFD